MWDKKKILVIVLVLLSIYKNGYCAQRLASNFVNSNAPSVSKKKFSVSKIAEICRIYKRRDFLLLSKKIQQIPYHLYYKLKCPDCFCRAVGTYLILEQNFSEALKWYKKIEKFEFNDVVNLSYLYIKTNNLAQAKDVLTKALIKYENETHLLYNLAIVYVKEKDYSKARECLFKVLNSPVEEDLKAKTLRLLNYIGY